MTTSPGDLLRALAEWYDKTGESMPNRITLARHSRDQVADKAYLAAFCERYDLDMLPREGRAGSFGWAELHLVTLPNVTVDVVNWADQ